MDRQYRPNLNVPKRATNAQPDKPVKAEPMWVGYVPTANKTPTEPPAPKRMRPNCPFKVKKEKIDPRYELHANRLTNTNTHNTVRVKQEQIEAHSSTHRPVTAHRPVPAVQPVPAPQSVPAPRPVPAPKPVSAPQPIQAPQPIPALVQVRSDPTPRPVPTPASVQAPPQASRPPACNGTTISQPPSASSLSNTNCLLKMQRESLPSTTQAAAVPTANGITNKKQLREPPKFEEDVLKLLEKYPNALPKSEIPEPKYINFAPSQCPDGYTPEELNKMIRRWHRVGYITGFFRKFNKNKGIR